MPLVIFMRAANVAGHQVFQPSIVARNLAALGVVNIGAAGTFVVRKMCTERTVRSAFRKELSFEPDLTICAADDVLSFMRTNPFEGFPTGKDYVHCVGVMAEPSVRSPRLPIIEKPGRSWQVKVTAVAGRFAVILRRRTGESVLDPSAVVEKNFGVRVHLAQLVDILEDPCDPRRRPGILITIVL